ncbi:MAG TPA: signal peptidase II [Longimicrobium sp.]|nr:signal peptidase II [Longimicrobium sp.]
MNDTAMTQTRPVAVADTPAESRAKTTLYASIVGGVVLADQITKYIVERNMRLYDPIPVMGDFFRLTFIYNRGAAFGLNVGEWSRIVFMVLAMVAAVALGMMYRSTPWRDRVRLFAIAGVTGGAVGNLIDRIRSSRGVVDFFDFGFGDHRWPVFNIADIFVTCGALILAFSLWREEQHNGKGDGSAG